jgi:cobalamin synthase
MHGVRDQTIVQINACTDDRLRSLELMDDVRTGAMYVQAPGVQTVVTHLCNCLALFALAARAVDLTPQPEFTALPALATAHLVVLASKPILNSPPTLQLHRGFLGAQHGWWLRWLLLWR